MPVGEIALPGEHSVSNVLAAVSVALVAGVAPDAIRSAVSSFTGIPHRLETVAVIDGIRYVNDSQATQPDAVAAAVRSFPKPLVLIVESAVEVGTSVAQEIGAASPDGIRATLLLSPIGSSFDMYNNPFGARGEAFRAAVLARAEAQR